MVPTKKPAIAAMHRRALVVIFVVKTGRATFGRLELPPGEGRFVGPPYEKPPITAYTAGSFTV